MNATPLPAQDPLAQLRDIHLPDAVSAWPPAPGWWILAAIVLVLLAVGIYYCIQYIRRTRYRRQALKQLAALEQYHRQPTTYLQRLNHLLKQTALAADSSVDVAGLSGQQWLAFLDHSGNTTHFKQGAGTLLLQGPYLPEHASATIPATTITELQKIARQWIKHHDGKRGGMAPC